MNRTNFIEWIRSRGTVRILDGSMGVLLSERGWRPPMLPEEMNTAHPDVVRGVYRDYIAAGADIIETNTFGGSPRKLAHRHLEAQARRINAVSAAMAREEANGAAMVAGSVGPLGDLLAPFGPLSFEEARAAFAEQIRGLLDGGADFILIETMIDIREAQAAVQGMKDADPDETTAFVVSLTFEHKGRTVTGTPPEVAAHWARRVGAAGIGANCGVGPDAYIPVVETLAANAGIPVFVYANGGLPGEDTWSPDRFAASCVRLARAGASVVGGCCRTTPEHIRILKDTLSGMPLPAPAAPDYTPLASRSRLVASGPESPFLIIGERINVSRKSPIKDDAARYSWSSSREEARLQAEAGAGAIDVNVGLPQIDRVRAMSECADAVSQAVDLPLSLDSDDIGVLQAGLRSTVGIPILNSVTAKHAALTRGLELAKRWGTNLVVLTIDEDGVPSTAEGRIAIAQKIAGEADRLGVPRSAIFVDCLSMAVGADQKAPRDTLDAIRAVSKLGVRTVLGVSNISHRMPVRPLLNRTFLAMAMASGLDAAIINPLDATLLATIRAAELLAGRDPGAGRYLADAPLLSDIETSAGPALRSGLAGQSKAEIACDALPCFRALADAIIRGDHEAAVNAVNVLLEEGHQPVETVNGGVIPALDAVGRLYDAGRYFLPQLIASAHAAQRVCDTALARLEASGASACPGRILLATVEGDLHDLGKNVVGTILKSHGYAVTDLGKDVPTAEILAAAGRERPDIVGLSALMTSTMEEMERAARQLKARFPGIRVMVGGASVNQAFADRIGADGYAGDAVASVRLVTRLLHGGEAR